MYNLVTRYGPQISCQRKWLLRADNLRDGNCPLWSRIRKIRECNGNLSLYLKQSRISHFQIKLGETMANPNLPFPRRAKKVTEFLAEPWKKTKVWIVWHDYCSVRTCTLPPHKFEVFIGKVHLYDARGSEHDGKEYWERKINSTMAYVPRNYRRFTKFNLVCQVKNKNRIFIDKNMFRYILQFEEK